MLRNVAEKGLSRFLEKKKTTQKNYFFSPGVQKEIAVRNLKERGVE